MNIFSVFATIVHYLFQYLFTFFVVLMIIFCDLIRLRKAIPPLLKFWAAMLFWTMGIGIEVRGKENLDRSRIQVLASNHSSAYDIPALYFLVPNSSFIGKQSLMKIPVFSNMLKAIGYISIDPRNIRQSMEALKEGTNTLDHGRPIAIFPEGTRTMTGELGPFKRGFVKILRESDAVLQPISMKGLFEMKPKTSRIIHHQRKIVITVHPTIERESIDLLDDKDLVKKTRDIIHSALG